MLKFVLLSLCITTLTASKCNECVIGDTSGLPAAVQNNANSLIAGFGLFFCFFSNDYLLGDIPQQAWPPVELQKLVHSYNGSHRPVPLGRALLFSRCHGSVKLAVFGAIPWNRQSIRETREIRFFPVKSRFSVPELSNLRYNSFRVYIYTSNTNLPMLNPIT